MIFDTILGFVYSVVTFLVNLLPVWAPWDLTAIAGQISFGTSSFGDLGPNANSVWHWLPWFDAYVPISEAVLLLTLSVTVYAGVLTAKFVLWVLNVTHITGSS